MTIPTSQLESTIGRVEGIARPAVTLLTPGIFRNVALSSMIRCRAASSPGFFSQQKTT
jgi:hypothetical protein